MDKVICYDPTASDKLSAVRGVGRYFQILKENFPEWIFTDKLVNSLNQNSSTIFINPFFNFLQRPLTLKRLAKKQIAVIHDLIPLKYPSHFPIGLRGKTNIFLNKIALKNYDLVVTDSQASKKDIINILGLPDNKIKVVYPCLPKIFNETKNENNSSKFIINDSKFCLYVGDATWNKNLVNLAKAIKIANIPCVFVGKAFSSETRQNVNSLKNKWQTELKQFLIETKDDKRFIFAGYLLDFELIKLYQQAIVNLLLSRAEGFGFSYLEASSQGCPSILSDIPVFQEISNQSQALQRLALFTKTEDPYDIANKIKQVYFDKNLRNKLGKKVKKQIDFFSSSKFRKKFLHLL